MDSLVYVLFAELRASEGDSLALEQAARCLGCDAELFGKRSECATGLVGSNKLPELFTS